MVESELTDKAETAYTAAMEDLYTVEGWNSIEQRDNFSSYRKNTESGLDSFKLDAWISASPEMVADFIYNKMSKLFLEFNADVMELSDCVFTVNENMKIIKELTKSPFPGVTPREMLFLKMKLELGEGNFAIIDTSVELEDHPRSQEAIRAEIKYCLHLIEPFGNDLSKTKLSVVTYAEAKGNIPSNILNHGLSKRSKFYGFMIDKIKEIAQAT